jgi:hypothetical protein
MTDPKTALEKFFGHPATEAAGTILALFYPIAAPLPALTNRFASGRFAKRIEDTMTELNTELVAQGKVDTFSDEQCALAAGIVETMFRTIEEQKLRMLKAAVLNIADSNYLEHFDAQNFSRILRDLSAAEMSFLAKNREFSSISFARSNAENADRVIYLDRGSADGVIARSLINHGLFARSPSEGHADDTGEYLAAPFIGKLLDLVLGVT